MKIQFVSAVYNEDSFKRNLKLSSIYSPDNFIIQRGYINAFVAYNNIPKLDCDLICYVHEDVYLPDDWEENLLKSLKKMDQIDKNWGVLGVAGVGLEKRGRTWHGNLIDRGRPWGGLHNLPACVQTLDELLLIRKNNDGLQFDELIPSNHFYGADICLQAQDRGQRCYAINAPCHHNSKTRRLPEDFHIAADYIKEKWRAVLPVATTCAILQD